MSRSESIISVLIVSRSSTGLILELTWVILSESKHLTKWIIASTSLIWERNLFPRPSPFDAPLTNPAISTKVILVYIFFLELDNFVNLSNDGYYDDIIFHRVIKGFMIQGGDPSGTGHGEMGKYPGYEFEDELDYPMNYAKGIVAMANRGPNTNGSQFFIMHVDYPLPYQYTIFGKVSEGLDTVDSIANVQTGDNDKPVDDVVIKSVKITEK